MWDKAHELRKETGVASSSSVDYERIHLLSGILRCPECGGPMYTNKNAWTRKDGTYVERHYYTCSRAYQARGIECKYKSGLRKDIIEADVVKAIKELALDPSFAAEVKAKIGHELDTSEIDRELEGYEKALRQARATKETLERQIDTMPYDTPHRERKLDDLNKRLDRAYDELIEIERQIDSLKMKRLAVTNNALTLEQIYKILENFGTLFDIMSDVDKKATIRLLAKEIEVTKEAKSKTDSWLKSITLNFPVFYRGSLTDRIYGNEGDTLSVWS